MPTLSERLLAWAEYHRHYGPDREEGTVRDRALTQKEADLREAARRLAPVEQPPVAELLARADRMDSEPDRFLTTGDIHVWAHESRAHARALVALAEAQAKLARVESILVDRRKKYIPSTPYSEHSAGRKRELDNCTDDIEAALAGAGGEREVPDANLS